MPIQGQPGSHEQFLKILSAAEVPDAHGPLLKTMAVVRAAAMEKFGIASASFPGRTTPRHAPAARRSPLLPERTP